MDLAKKTILQAIKEKIKDKTAFNKLKQAVFSTFGKEQPPNQTLLKVYRELLRRKKIAPRRLLEEILKTREIRTLSGVAVITVLTKPYPCPGKCIYCPSVASMPKSYLPNEPAAARALSLKFNPYMQVKKRIEVLRMNGHKTDKIELIVKGGTWSAYQKKYREWFIKRCFDAANDADGRKDGVAKTKSLEEAQKLNEKTANRVVGLTLETRPDFVTPEEIAHLRKLGCTRIELGVQTIDDRILKLVKRGHTAEQVAAASKLLRSAGFKIDYHLMPALPGASPKKDLGNFKKIFTDSAYRPDMIKVYPCSVLPGTDLYELWKNGKYKPPTTKRLIDLIIRMKLATPRYVRISRIIRDIPGNDIAAGNKVTSLRQNVQNEMNKRGLRCKCIRCKEVGRGPRLNISDFNPRTFIKKYSASGGLEYFLSIEDRARNMLFAFCRLRLQKNKDTKIVQLLPELENAALIRELHTYGHLVPIDEQLFNASQHKGLGRRLMKKAEAIARQNGYKKIAVISGVGVREYYKKLGYRLKGTYMVKKL